MKEAQAGPWLRLVGEFVVIVAGVLIALSADSWMESQADDRAEAAHLEALLDEFQQSVATLGAASEYKGTQMAALRRLLSNEVQDLPADSLDRWIYDGVYVTGGYAPVLSALRDLDASGERDLIANPAIRRGLALLNVRLEGAERSYGEYVFYHQTVLDPFIANELPIAALLAGRNGVEVDPVSHPDWSLLDTDRAHGVLMLKLDLAANYIGALEALGTQFQVLVNLIGERLAMVGR
jgi:hypothetical protein